MTFVLKRNWLKDSKYSFDDALAGWRRKRDRKLHTLFWSGQGRQKGLSVSDIYMKGNFSSSGFEILYLDSVVDILVIK